MSDTSSFQKVNKQPNIHLIFGSLSLFLVITGCFLAYRQFARSQEVAQRPKPLPVEQTKLTIVVSANGTVDPEKVVNVSPKTAGILKKLLVDEGDEVKQNQVIALMDDSNLQGQLLEAEGRLTSAEANLSKLITGNRPQEIAQGKAKLEALSANLSKLIAGNRSQDIEQARAQLDSAKALSVKAEDEFRRNDLLLKEGAISEQTLKEKLAARDSNKALVVQSEEKLSLMKEGTRKEEIEQARADVKSQKETFDLLSEGTRKEEIEQARAGVVSARGSLQSIKTQINDTVIRAPFDGIIAFKYADPGAFVTPTTSGSSVSSATSSSILSIISKNQVVTNVSENNIEKIRVGQKVLIKADALPGKEFRGRVSQIATQATVKQNVTSFKVEVALEGNAAKELKAGMNVSAEFQVGELKNALTVPTIAVTRQNNITGVFVGAPNQPPRFVPITTGVTINNRTEVKSGLNGTEHILINAPSEKPPQSGFSWQNLFGGSSDERPRGGPPPRGGPSGGEGNTPPGGGGGAPP